MIGRREHRQRQTRHVQKVLCPFVRLYSMVWVVSKGMNISTWGGCGTVSNSVSLLHYDHNMVPKSFCTDRGQVFWAAGQSSFPVQSEHRVAPKLSGVVCMNPPLYSIVLHPRFSLQLLWTGIKIGTGRCLVRHNTDKHIYRCREHSLASHVLMLQSQIDEGTRGIYEVENFYFLRK